MTRSLIRGRALNLFLTVVIVACANDTDSAGKSNARESSVRIDPPVSVITPSDWQNIPEWSIAGPLFVIGDTTDAVNATFHDSNDAALLSDGRFIIPNGGYELQIFSPEGKHVRTIGRRGRGPGEFGMMYSIGRLRGDTIFAYDVGNRNVSLFSPTGEFVRAIPTSPMQRARHVNIGVLDNGFLVMPVRRGMPPMEHPETYRDTVIVVTVAPDGTVTDTLGLMADVLMTGGGSRSSIMSLKASGRRVYFVSSDSYDIHAFEDGRALRVMRIEIPEQTHDDAGGRKIFPPMSGRLQIDSQNNLWVVMPTSAKGPDFLVFNEAGVLIARVMLPDDLYGVPVEITNDRVIGMHSIEVNTPVYKIYELKK